MWNFLEFRCQSQFLNQILLLNGLNSQLLVKYWILKVINIMLKLVISINTNQKDTSRRLHFNNLLILWDFQLKVMKLWVIHKRLKNKINILIMTTPQNSIFLLPINQIQSFKILIKINTTQNLNYQCKDIILDLVKQINISKLWTKNKTLLAPIIKFQNLIRLQWQELQNTQVNLNKTSFIHLNL